MGGDVTKKNSAKSQTTALSPFWNLLCRHALVHPVHEQVEPASRVHHNPDCVPNACGDLGGCGSGSGSGLCEKD
jgi:hypothetical protein